MHIFLFRCFGGAVSEAHVVSECCRLGQRSSFFSNNIFPCSTATHHLWIRLQFTQGTLCFYRKTL